MKFKSIDYLNWAKTSFHGASDAIDLATSGFPPRTLDDLYLTPEHLQIQAPNTYGWGPLKEAIANFHGLTHEEIVITAGASMANFLTIMAHTSPGDTVLVEQPIYEPMKNLPLLFGGKVESLERHREAGWKLSGGLLRETLERTGAKLVVISNPHNPSGVRMNHEEMNELLETVASFDARLILDEVYAEFHDWNPAAHADAIRAGTLIRLSSLTKVYGFGPLRLGWILSDQNTTGRLLELTNYTYAVHGAINERIGLAVWDERERFRDEARKRAAFNLETIRKFLGTQDRLSWEDPEAGILGFIQVLGMNDTTPFVDQLKQEHDVMVVPGHFFGMTNGFRVGLGNRPDQVRTALHRMGKALAQFPVCDTP